MKVYPYFYGDHALERTMFRKSIAAAVLVAGAAFVPAAAEAATGYTTEPTELLAGPDYDYPVIRTINYDRRVEIFGCLNDWSFCDVGYRSDRGWVDGRDIVVDYRARRVSLLDAGPYVGIGFLSFSFGNYWDTYYRGRPFYHDRYRWERHYHDHWRTSWGPRRDWDRRDWDRRDRDRRDWNDRDRDRRDWNRRDNDRRDFDRRGDNDRRDFDRRGDNDRRDNDNRTSYRGAPNPPAVTTPTQRPAVTTPEQRQQNLRERSSFRPDRDIRRDNDRRDAIRERSVPQTTTPQNAPTIDRGDRGMDRPNRDMTRPDRPERGAAMDRGNRQALERPDRGGGMERREQMRQAPQQREERPRPQQRPRGKDDDENRPGR
jgi:uncharacterized protein YraI